MAGREFFREIEHRKLAWGERSVHVPVFYRDVATMSVLFSASLGGLRKLLPSSRLHPIRVGRRRGLLSIVAHEFRDSDFGPYNEVGLLVPVTLDVPSPLLKNLFGRGHGEPMVLVHQLPVTTEIARDAGVQFAGYPKFLAQIVFEEDADWRTCRLTETGQHILTVRMRKHALHDAPRSRSHCLTLRGGMLLRSEIIASERTATSSKKRPDVRLELGDHPIAQELAKLGVGRAIGSSHAPSYQLILTPVIESFTA